MQLIHGRVPIELHELKSAQGRSLLLLHALGASANSWPAEILDWPDGPVYALDFAGHGKSGRVRGGAYYPEYFLGDADLALEKIGEPCAVVGAGIGAYVTLMLAGSRVDSVLGGLLLAGPGLEGVGSHPDDEIEFDGIEAVEHFVVETSKDWDAETDPLVAFCASDMRPLDYAASFARAARPLLFSEGVGRDHPAPAWWKTARKENPGVAASAALPKALVELAGMMPKA